MGSLQLLEEMFGSDILRNKLISSFSNCLISLFVHSIMILKPDLPGYEVRKFIYLFIITILRPESLISSIIKPLTLSIIFQF